MKLRRLLEVTGSLGLMAAAGLMLAGLAWAGDQYQSSVVPYSFGLTNTTGTGFQVTKSGKIKQKPSTKPGDGGITTQLILTNVDCPPNNDAGKAGKCGVKDNPICDHVMTLGTSALGSDLAESVGINYCLEQGKAYFEATGKNKLGGAAFGALVTVIFNRPLGIGTIKFRKPGTDPEDCAGVPLPPMTCKGGTGACFGPSGRGDACACTGNSQCASNSCTAQGCSNGAQYAIAGIVAGSDPDLNCSTSADCGLTQVCSGGLCITESCTADAQCDQNGTGNGGTGQCGSDGMCCDPNIETGCAGEV